jgi:hypothetical protein
MPDTAVIVQPNIFDKNEMLAAKRKKIKVKGYAASKAGMTCDQVMLVCCSFDAALPTILSLFHISIFYILNR